MIGVSHGLALELKLKGSAVAVVTAVETGRLVRPDEEGPSATPGAPPQGGAARSGDMEKRDGRRAVNTAVLQGWVDLVFEDHHPSSQRHPPYDVEVAAFQEWNFTYNPTRDEDRNALRDLSWNWPVACAWVAWQTFDGAALGVAAYRTWRGRIWREGPFNVRPGRLMLMSDAELALRNALQAGDIVAEAARGDDDVTISRSEWARLAWETNSHGEVIEFDHLLKLNVPRYEGVTLSRAAVMRLWPARDGWVPVDVPVINPPGPVEEARTTETVVEKAPQAVEEPSDTKQKGVGECVDAEVTVIVASVDNVRSSDPAEKARAARSEHVQARISSLRRCLPDLSKPKGVADLRRLSDEYQRAHNRAPLKDSAFKKELKQLRSPQKC